MKGEIDMPIVDGIIVGGTKDKTINYSGEVIIADDHITIKEEIKDMATEQSHEETEGKETNQEESKP